MKNKWNEWWNKFLQWPIIVNIVIWSQNHSLPGFHDVSIYTTLTFIRNELNKNDLNTRASAMSYSFFLALFPSLIFLFTLTAYFPKSWDFYSAMENSIVSVMPDRAQDYIWKDIVSTIRPKAKSGLLSIGFILALVFASNGMLTMMKGFDKTYKSSFRKRSWTQKQLIAILLTFLLGILLIFSVLILILGGQIFKWIFGILHLSKLTVIAVKFFQYLIIILLFYSVIELMYRLAPALKKPFSFFSPGTIFATIGSIITSVLFGYFVDHFSTYHKVYGAISALIITLIWIRLNVLILILGFELNAGIIINRDIRQLALIQNEED